MAMSDGTQVTDTNGLTVGSSGVTGSAIQSESQDSSRLTGGSSSQPSNSPNRTSSCSPTATQVSEQVVNGGSYSPSSGHKNIMNNNQDSSQNNVQPVVPAMQPKRLHVSNIPFRFRDPDLRQLFGVSSLTGDPVAGVDDG